MKEAFEKVRAAGGVCISDEVQTGYNRCGRSFFGFEANDAIPDMVTVAKGMGNGIGIIAAVISRRSIAESFTNKMWFNTYGSNPVACAVARSVLKVMKEDDLRTNCQRASDQFKAKLTKTCEKYPQAYKEIRGEGLFLGLEAAGETLEQAGINARDMHVRLLKHGVVAGRGSAAGNVFRIQPPLCIGMKDVEHVCDAFEEVAQEWIKEKGL